MSWILFLVFMGASQEPLLQFDDAETCYKWANNLSQRDQAMRSQFTEGMMGAMSLHTYVCAAVPKKYKMDK
jgi:hypothetical protein